MTAKSSHVVHALPYPALEAGNLSFPEGSYEPQLKMGADGCSVAIGHVISGVPFIDRLIEEGSVGFYCLFSVARSGVRKLYKTDKVDTINWDDSIVSDPPKLRPILVYTGEDREYTFTKECGVAELWQGKTITLPKGARLARGSFLNLKSSQHNLLRFKHSQDYKAGTFKVEENTEDGFYFVVTAATDVFNFVQQNQNNPLRRAILTAVVARCFSILKEDYKGDGRSDGFSNLRILSAHLAEKGYDYDWNDEEFDPMLAATTLDPVRVQNDQQASDDEGDE